ncbi:S1 family peptidase [Parablastomonas sp. CN1-191]|uniref:S1 family peptidase n=1 Tax=Parablastomonas sp. CN1-191 TaxID=3400908 RepID=UPI003BF884DB
MLSRILAAFALVLSLAALPGRAAAEPADISAAARGVVRIVLVRMGDDGPQMVGHGSGLAVTGNTVITNAHVVAPLAEDENLVALVVPSQGKRGWGAKVRAYSPGNDLALLTLVGGGNLPPLAFTNDAVPDGAQVYAVGYPGNVDMAQGLGADDMIMPMAPVKTEGTVSAGRSSKSFDTILHTAPLAAGNSGGPLLDACGRVVGVNSFSTMAESSEADFFFAVSMREISRFLKDQGVTPRTSALPCRSMADLDRTEAERLAAERQQADAASRLTADQKAALAAKAQRTAELDVMSERENRMALAGLALLMALATAGAGLWLGQQDRGRERTAAFVAAAALLVCAGIAWFSRPPLSEIEDRAAALTADGTASPPAAAKDLSGALTCVIDPARSRVTVSDTSDVPVDWQPDGCVNKRTQYGRDTTGWARVLVPNGEDTVTVARFDPATGTYATARYLLDADTMARARAARGKVSPPQCGAPASAVEALGSAQADIIALLPQTPNERLVYHCSQAAGGAP